MCIPTLIRGSADLRACLERAGPVYSRRHLVRPRQAQLPGMPPEVAQRIETLLRYGVQRLLDYILHAAALARGGEFANDPGYGLGLSSLGKLLEIEEIDALAAELDGAEVPAAGSLAPAASQVYGGGPDTAAFRRAYILISNRGAGRKLRCDLAGLRRGIGGLVVLHQDHTVRNVEVVADAANHHDCRDAQSAVQRAHQVYKRGDGLFPDQLAHPLVPDHEVRRARVLVHQEERGRAGSVWGREVLRGPPSGQLPDHGRDVHPRDAATVLGPDLDRVGPRHHELSAVSRHVVVDPPRERREQRALPVEAAPRDERYAFRNPHPDYLAAVWQLHGDP